MSNNEARIRVNVKSEFVPEQSDPGTERYVFAYHIAITNEGEEPARLLTRHWVITDGEAKVEEVRGDGVVGQQPSIAPGETYEYSSGAILKTPVGSMQGSYGMIDEHGERFEAPIPVFRLAVPRMVH
ncbi:MAG: Co2+/Mg2+ efflux protein ApaG [Fluviicoccus sp.]|uniref:Co2+/Mg2+ efflux protein ApaG n=1 Tax=Fluviicoccus sp. TaxID=2003552 RepID=UPI00271EC79E|nr:Co2+/Mg2+ efflux protein ApaG [Fluviicoccus sp.]MDO8331343.1 Co2+/Mg2+ efflux protein ApaG [Fluviicoccus sp.]